MESKEIREPRNLLGRSAISKTKVTKKPTKGTKELG